MLWTNLRSYPVSKFSGCCCLKSCSDNLLLVSVSPCTDRKTSYLRTPQRDACGVSPTTIDPGRRNNCLAADPKPNSPVKVRFNHKKIARKRFSTVM